MLDHLDIEGLIRMIRSHQSCHRHKTKISFLNWEMILNVTYQFIGEIKWVFFIKFEKWKRWNFAIECSPSCLVFSNLYPKTFEWDFASATLSVWSFLMIWYTWLISLIYEINEFQYRRSNYNIESRSYKVGCVFPMVVVSMLPHADFGPNDHRDDALHFIQSSILKFVSSLYEICQIVGPLPIIAFLQP